MNKLPITFIVFPMNEHQDLFALLKRNQRLSLPQKTLIRDVFFQILFDDKGAFLQVVNNKGKPVTAHYEHFSGSQRQVLKGLQTMALRNGFNIQWETDSNKCYLGENESILWPLQHCTNLVDEDLKPLTFQAEQPQIQISLDETNGQILNSRVSLITEHETYTDFRFLSESQVLAADKIYRIQPVGENYNLLRYFGTVVFTNRLDSFLALFFSFFENISLNYRAYSLTTGEPRKTSPALIIEQVDQEHSLYLRVTRHLEGFDTGFLDEYDISRIATCNELEQQIILREVIHESIHNCCLEIEKKLRKHSTELKEKKEYQEPELNLFIIEENLARQFIFKELSHLLTHYTVIGTEKLIAYKVRTVTPNLRLRLSHGINFLEGDAELEIGDQLIPLFEVINQYNRNSYVTLNDGTHAVINRDYIRKLKRIFKKPQQTIKLSFFDLPLIDELIDAKISGAAFNKSRRIFLGFNTLAGQPYEPPPIKGELREYQKQGFKWLRYLRDNALGGCLADDMGLGKTIQTIALLATIYPKQKACSLIIMPKSLLFNWESEIRKFCPALKACIYHGTGRNLKQAGKSHLILTTYATVRNDIKKLQQLEFHYIILDESQHIKNAAAQTTKAVMLLSGSFRLALSGTPVENNLGELYSLFRFLNPPMFGSLDEFNRDYTTPIQKQDDKTALAELKKRIYPFILRRLKRDVIQDLPEKIEQILYVDLSEQQKLIYEQRRIFYYQTITNQIAAQGINKSQFFILQALTELRQIATIPEVKIDESIPSAKLEVLSESILDAVANNHKILVFANFLGALNSIAATLEQEDIPYLVMTGATGNRKELVEKFQSNSRYKVFLMTLKTGGLGLNLTAADCVYIYDPWWNIAAENQAIDRTHRIGQDKTVFCYKLIARGTIEEKILKLQEIKQELFNSLISSDGASIKSLSEEDVKYVLGE